MSFRLLGQKNYGSQDALAYAIYDFSGGLNIKSLPQELDDSELTAAVNVYLRAEGGVEMRRGIKQHGPSLGATPCKGVFRFFQQVRNGAQVSFSQTIVQQAGNLNDLDAGGPVGNPPVPANVLGAGANPMVCRRVYDPQHLLNPPNVAISNQLVAGTSTAPGTVYIVFTYTNPFGESLQNLIVASNTTDATHQIQCLSPAAYGNATGWNCYAGTAGTGGPFYKQNTSPIAIGTNFTIPSTLLTTTAAPTTNTATAPSDVVVICTGVGGPYIYDGLTVYTPSGWAGVAGAQWCEVLNGILWFGGIPSQPNLLQGSMLGQPETLFYANAFACDGPITGLCASGQGPQSGLVIGLNRGVQVLYGTGLLNWYMQSIPMQDGVVAGRTMIAVDGIVYYLGRLAIYAFDGQQSYPISEKVEPWIMNDPLYPDYPMNGNRAISFAFWYNHRLHFAYDTGNVGYCNAFLVCHLNVKNSWTVLFGPKLAGACLLDAPGDGIGVNTYPAPCVVVDGTTGLGYDWDVYNGAGANGHGVDDNGSVIQTLVLSKYFKIGEPGTTKRIQRYYPELFVEQFNGQAIAFTNYGATNSTEIINQQSVGSGLSWDVGNWDVNTWAGNPLTWITQRVDVDLEGEAFAFGITSNDTNPPYRFVGVSGTFAQEARN